MRHLSRKFLKMQQQHTVSIEAKVGEMITCPCCLERVKKTEPQQAFCTNETGIGCHLRYSEAAIDYIEEWS